MADTYQLLTTAGKFAGLISSLLSILYSVWAFYTYLNNKDIKKKESNDIETAERGHAPSLNEKFYLEGRNTFYSINKDERIASIFTSAISLFVLIMMFTAGCEIVARGAESYFALVLFILIATFSIEYSVRYLLHCLCMIAAKTQVIATKHSVIIDSSLVFWAPQSWGGRAGPKPSRYNKSTISTIVPYTETSYFLSDEWEFDGKMFVRIDGKMFVRIKDGFTTNLPPLPPYVRNKLTEFLAENWRRP